MRLRPVPLESSRLRSVDRVRLIVYPAVLALALAAGGFRLGWFHTNASVAASLSIELRGQTDERQPITVSLDRGGDVEALQTQLTGRCSNGGTYRIGWAPNNPRVPFHKHGSAFFVRESSQEQTPSGIRSRTFAWTAAHLGGEAAIGDARYLTIFRYPDGRLVRCDSGFVHWVANRTGTATAAAQSRFSFGQWAGYAWRGEVRSVQASWTVPHILNGSPAGYAATWIGAQGSPGRSKPLAPTQEPSEQWARSTGWSWLLSHTPFIQVGINEERLIAASGRTSELYYAFWTDTIHHDSPIVLFAVRPGDEISAALTVADHRWKVSIADATSGTHAFLFTRDYTGAVFDEAEWLQEHPSSNPFGTDPEDTYPQLSTVRITHLAVDATKPRSADMLSAWMSEDGGYLAPAPLRNDGFVFQPATLSRAGQRYLAIAGAEDAATQRFVETGGLDAAAPGSLRGTGAARLAAALRTMAEALTNSRWPAPVKPLIARLTTVTRELFAQTVARRNPSSASFTRWRSQWLEDAYALSVNATLVRRALNIPQFRSVQ